MIVSNFDVAVSCPGHKGTYVIDGDRYMDSIESHESEPTVDQLQAILNGRRTIYD